MQPQWTLNLLAEFRMPVQLQLGRRSANFLGYANVMVEAGGER